MTGFTIFLTILLIILLGLTAFVFDQRADKITAFLMTLLIMPMLLIGISMERHSKTIENLKTEFPVLAEAMHEKELKSELEKLLDEKQTNDKRYSEIVEELGEVKWEQ